MSKQRSRLDAPRAGELLTTKASFVLGNGIKIVHEELFLTISSSTQRVSFLRMINGDFLVILLLGDTYFNKRGFWTHFRPVLCYEELDADDL